MSGGGVLVDSGTISLGKDPVLVSGISAALHSNADLALGTSTVQRIFPPSESLAVTLNIASHLFIAFANNVAIDGETLTRNTRPITISGTPKLLGLEGLVVGTLTVPLHILAPESITPLPADPPVLLSGHLIISGTTVTSPILAFKIAGNLVSLGMNGLFIGTSMVPLPSSQPASSIIIGGYLVPFSLAADGIVIAGTTVVFKSSARLVIGTSTLPVQNLAPSPLPGIGDFIYSAINGGLEASTVPVSTAGVGSQARDNNSTEPFFGDAERVRSQSLALVIVMTTVPLAFFFWEYVTFVNLSFSGRASVCPERRDNPRKMRQ